MFSFVDPNTDNSQSALRVLTTWMPEAVVPAVSPDGDDVFKDLKKAAAILYQPDGWRRLAMKTFMPAYASV